MSRNRKTAALAGILILAAYSMLASAATQIKPIVMATDLISGLAVIWLAGLMFPLFKKTDKKLAIGYLFFKILEGALMITAGFLYLSDSSQHLRTSIYEGVQVYTFAFGAILFYYLLLKTRLVPKFISQWGLVAASALLTITTLKSINISHPLLDVLLILMITNEIFLAIWLIVRGLNQRVSKISN